MPTIDFLWDEWSDNVLQETDENNVVTTYFQRPEKYGEVLYHKAGSRFSFYHFDGNGSTRKLTNVSQSTIKTSIFSGFGELVASSGTGSTPFAYKGAAGYYTNPVTNDIYVRARTYEPTTGRWLSKDPLGFVDGPNLYGAYWLPCSFDPSGLWVHVRGNIYEAEGDEDSLMSLSREIVANNADWVCIWPIGQESLWTGYPWAKRCAQADVSNLVVKPGKLVKMRQSFSDPSDDFMLAVDDFWGTDARVWESGADAATYLRDKSQQGDKPIGNLLLGGHNFQGNSGISIGNNTGGPVFQASDLFPVADEKNNRTNTFEHAYDRIGPPKCWFTRNAKVYGFACNTHEGWTTNWANTVLRTTATALGATPLVYAEWRDAEGKIRRSITRIGQGRINWRMNQLLKDPDWQPVSGTQ